jgi:hypothetical protein
MGAAAQPVGTQPNPPRRAALSPKLTAASQHLASHPHPYAMSEEVARVRLRKMGFEKAEALRPAGTTIFQAEVTKNGQPQKVEIDRISGSVKTIP